MAALSPELPLLQTARPHQLRHYPPAIVIAAARLPQQCHRYLSAEPHEHQQTEAKIFCFHFILYHPHILSIAISAARGPCHTELLAQTAAISRGIFPAQALSDRLPLPHCLKTIKIPTALEARGRTPWEYWLSGQKAAPKICRREKSEIGMFFRIIFPLLFQVSGGPAQDSRWLSSHLGNASAGRTQMRVAFRSPRWLHWKAEQRAEVSLVRNAASSTSWQCFSSRLSWSKKRRPGP